MQSFLKTLAFSDLATEADRVAKDIEQEHTMFFKFIDSETAIEDVWQIPEAQNINYRLHRLYSYYQKIGDELCSRTIEAATKH